MILNNDVLKGRFTVWMQVVVKRAKIDYIRRLNRRANEISLEDDQIIDKLIYEPFGERLSFDGLEFNNKVLSVIFNKLPPKRKRVLELLFVHNMSPEEIAKEMGCSVRHIYNMRSLALTELRQKYEKAGK